MHAQGLSKITNAIKIAAVSSLAVGIGVLNRGRIRVSQSLGKFNVNIFFYEIRKGISTVYPAASLWL
jgi:hypothetical protein